MLHPIQTDHETICPGCGAVLSQIEEMAPPINQIAVTANIQILGSALEKNIKYAYGKTGQQSREEEILMQLEHVIKKYGLPERFVIETFNQMKKKNRGFWSDTEFMKQLIKILSKDENYFFMKKLRLLKTEYEDIINN